MELVKNVLTTTNYTEIYKVENMEFNAPHGYIIKDKDNKKNICSISFQKGPVKEVDSINGIFMEDLISIVIDRLESFQNSEFRCRENAIAITKLEESLMWLRKRTLDRQARGVQGTYEK
jgi:hypothetical protein